MNNNQAGLNIVIEYIENLFKYSSDIYHKDNPSPIFANGINVRTKEHLKWVSPPDGRISVISNLASQQNLMRILTSLTNITGNDKYKKRAKLNFEYYFKNYQSKNGLLYWGGHRFIDLLSLYPSGPDEKNLDKHELKNNFPYYELMFETDHEQTEKFIKAFWGTHVLDWNILDITRHGDYEKEIGNLWDNSFSNPEPFFETEGLSFLSAGNDLIYAGIYLYKFTGDNGALLWSKRLAEQYIKARNSKTKLGVYQFTQPRKTLDTKDHSDTLSYYGDRAKRQFGPEFGDIALEGKVLLSGQAYTIYSKNALMQLQLSKELGSEAGKDFLYWTREGLASYLKYAYILEKNMFKPILTDGTDLSDYILKRDGYYGNKGEKLKQFKATNQFLLSYLRGFFLTKDECLWNMARQIAKANDLGEIGYKPGEKFDLNLNTKSNDAYALFSVLDIYQETLIKDYLELASVIGNNIINDKFHYGFFMPKDDYIYANVDSIEPYSLLALEAAEQGKFDAVPAFMNGSGYNDGEYLLADGKVITIHDTELFNEKFAEDKK